MVMSGSGPILQAILTDLLTIRADRDHYYYAMDAWKIPVHLKPRKSSVSVPNSQWEVGFQDPEMDVPIVSGKLFGKLRYLMG